MKAIRRCIVTYPLKLIINNGSLKELINLYENSLVEADSVCSLNLDALFVSKEGLQKLRFLQEKGWNIVEQVNATDLLVECALTATGIIVPDEVAIVLSGSKDIHKEQMCEMFHFLLKLPGVNLNVRTRFNEMENLITVLIKQLGDDCLNTIRLIIKVSFFTPIV